ncbi:hypothetical protein [Achromobacter animicus]|uniref:hypothetical protein n=1 Tax=Achromobacter animicus TaxID=1389935 RepID=UPI0028AAE06D|nr:hypothetical protein [Achromobacter animicus]
MTATRDQAWRSNCHAARLDSSEMGTQTLERTQNLQHRSKNVHGEPTPRAAILSDPRDAAQPRSSLGFGTMLAKRFHTLSV